MYYQRCWAQTLNQTAKMSQRLDNTKWLCCLLALHAGSFWGMARSVTVRTPPSNPSTIETQAKFFQDFFSVQLSPYKIEFGHVCEDPNTWEQRYERKDFENHRDMGKVRWGDKKGGYGEHYWDLNHAGHAGNHGDDSYDGDDGSYHESNNRDPYDEHSDNSPTYDNDDYDPEKSSYEESGRAKRHPKVDRGNKGERKYSKSSQREYEGEDKTKKQNRNNKEQLEAAETSDSEDYENDRYDESDEKPKRQKYNKEEENSQPKEKKQVVLVVSHKDDSENQKNQYLAQNQPKSSQYLTQAQPELPQYLPQRLAQLNQNVPKQHLEPPQFVPYEGGSGVRQHHQPTVSATTTVPRLFLEPSTGHVVDRATGQAYVLQPIAAHNNYN